jgi:hypothetical protein
LIRQLATDPNADIAKLQMIVDLHNSQQDRAARQEFEAEFVKMQAKLPKIAATRENSQTRSKYAKLEDIQAAVKPILAEHGFSTRYESPENQPHGMVVVTCVLTHKNGHSARNTKSIPVDSKGIGGNANKTETHGAASADSYARRYALCGVLDIAVGDDDGNAAGGVQRVTKARAGILNGYYYALPDNVKEVFLRKYGEVESVPNDKFNEALDWFKVQEAKAKQDANS